MVSEVIAYRVQFEALLESIISSSEYTSSSWKIVWIACICVLHTFICSRQRSLWRQMTYR